MYEREKAVAIETVKEATLLCQKIEKELKADDVILKEDRSPVTIADFISQILINLKLKNAFPNDEIMGEEDGTFLKSEKGKPFLDKILPLFPGKSSSQLIEILDQSKSQGATRFWVVDPIDGTQGFIRKEQYVVALALIEKGEVKLAVLGCPKLEGGIFLSAVKGEGAHLHSGAVSKKLQITRREKDFVYTEPQSYSILHSHEKAFEIASKLQPHPHSIPMDSQSKYAMLALSKASLYIRIPNPFYREKIWDHAAGLLIVEEAGGKVTDLDGNPLDFSKGQYLSKNRGVLGSDGFIHKAALKAVKETLSLDS